MPNNPHMADHVMADIFCPHCDAGYKVVRVKAESGGTYRLIRCAVCRGPLLGADGDDVLKYFLVQRPASRLGQGQQIWHPSSARTRRAARALCGEGGQVAVRADLYNQARDVNWRTLERSRRGLQCSISLVAMRIFGASVRRGRV